MSTGGRIARLSSEHRRFLIVDQVIGAGIINFILNAGIAWAIARALVRVPLWGNPSIANDTVATAFLLPFITCLIVTPLIRKRIVAGGILRIPEAQKSLVIRLLLARSTLVRGVLVGLGCVALVALPTVLLFALVGPSELSHGSFIWFKATFAALLAACVAPFLAWLALASPSSKDLSS
jgi:hypothetical protein